MNKIALYFHTLRYLKIKQIYYRLYYLFLDKFSRKSLKLTQQISKPFTFLNYHLSYKNKTYLKENTFKFLNISHTFTDGFVDWELMEYGKLWQYNLCYFDFLNQESLSKEEGIDLIKQFISSENSLVSAIEPYPTSLRVINWIRFISKHQIKDAEITDAIYIQTNYLSKRLEYHLLGNHLLENAFCLLHAGYFFKEEKFINISFNILKEELQEQILEDGGHFELSPMYHQIILFRVLEAIDLVRSNDFILIDRELSSRRRGELFFVPLKYIFGKNLTVPSFVGRTNLDKLRDEHLINLLETKASKMLSWLNNITFQNGDIPLLNDSAFGIAPSTFDIQKFSKFLNIKEIEIKLSTRGYRKYTNSHFEMIVDVGKTGADYQPGHAHADALNVVIYANNKPFIIDTGTSTYENNSRRCLERSTQSHNTVTFNNENQSQVWSSFRVAQRANIHIISETDNSIIAEHDGYKKFRLIHQRQVDVSDSQIVIKDFIFGTNEKVVAHFHFHPNCSIKLVGNILLIDNCQMIFSNFENIKVESYLFAPEFNQSIPSQKVLVEFRNALTTKITTN
jgi:Heparinase II/III-like protein/Heparinase II/III N-terminus